MYKMIIVDDEPLIRAGLKVLVEWEVYGIEIIGEADNGMQAYLQIKAEHPDLALIDISMPNMNGLELMELCSHLDTPPKFIILSGYSDFQFVQKAVQLGAVNYLLKPVDQDELINTIISSVRLLDNSKSHNQQFKESLLALQNNVLERILHNQIETPELREKCKVLSLSLHCCNMRIGVIRPLLVTSDAPIQPVFPFITDCQKHCTTLCPCYVLVTVENDIAILFKDSGNTLGTDDYHRLLYECTNLMKDSYNMEMTYALGRQVPIVQELSISYRDCLSELDKKQILGFQAEKQNYKDISFPHFDIAEFLTCIENCNLKKLSELLHNYFIEIASTIPGSNIEHVKYPLIELVSRTLQSQSIITLPPSKILLLKNEAFSILSEADQPQILEQDLTAFFHRILKRIKEVPDNGNYSLMVQHALTHLQEHYNDNNLSLKTLALHLEVNAAYLGRQFFLDTNEYFNDALNRIRISKSLVLLTSTTWKTAKIAEEVGFTSISYFFTIFKKIVNERPNDYRKKNSLPW